MVLGRMFRRYFDEEGRTSWMYALPIGEKDKADLYVNNYKVLETSKHLVQFYRRIFVENDALPVRVYVEDGNDIIHFLKQKKHKRFYLPINTAHTDMLEASWHYKELFRDFFCGLGSIHKRKYVHRTISAKYLLVFDNEDGVCGKITGLHEAIYCGGYEPNIQGWFGVEMEKKLDLMNLASLLGMYLTGKVINVIRETSKFKKLDGLKKFPEVLNLLQGIEDDKLKTVDEILSHPFFWSRWKRIEFFKDCSERINLYPPNSPYQLPPQLISLQNDVMKLKNKVNGLKQDYLGWKGNLRSLGGLLHDYDDTNDDTVVSDLLTAISNKSYHRQELPLSFFKTKGIKFEKTIEYSMEPYFGYQFPKLLIEIYDLVKPDLEKIEFFGLYYTYSDLDKVQMF